MAFLPFVFPLLLFPLGIILFALLRFLLSLLWGRPLFIGPVPALVEPELSHEKSIPNQGDQQEGGHGPNVDPPASDTPRSPSLETSISSESQSTSRRQRYPPEYWPSAAVARQDARQTMQDPRSFSSHDSNQDPPITPSSRDPTSMGSSPRPQPPVCTEPSSVQSEISVTGPSVDADATAAGEAESPVKPTQFFDATAEIGVATAAAAAPTTAADSGVSETGPSEEPPRMEPFQVEGPEPGPEVSITIPSGVNLPQRTPSGSRSRSQSSGSQELSVMLSKWKLVVHVAALYGLVVGVALPVFFFMDNVGQWVSLGFVVIALPYVFLGAALLYENRAVLWSTPEGLGIRHPAVLGEQLITCGPSFLIPWDRIVHCELQDPSCGCSCGVQRMRLQLRDPEEFIRSQGWRQRLRFHRELLCFGSPVVLSDMLLAERMSNVEPIINARAAAARERRRRIRIRGRAESSGNAGPSVPLVDVVVGP